MKLGLTDQFLLDLNTGAFGRFPDPDRPTRRSSAFKLLLYFLPFFLGYQVFPSNQNPNTQTIGLEEVDCVEKADLETRYSNRQTSQPYVGHNPLE